MNIKIFDLDDNGYSEIIMSSEWQTWIYEWQPGGTEEIKPGTMPYALCLEALPNPFRGQTRVKVQQSKAGTYKLEIYNVLGQKVRSLWSGYQPARVQDIVWDGCDDRNRHLGAGVYYCMYQMGGNKNTTKIVLLK